MPVNKDIKGQVKAWSLHHKPEPKPFITVSREYGSAGWLLAQELAEKLNRTKEHDPPWKAYNKEILSKIEKDHQLSKEIVETLDKPIVSALQEFFYTILSDKPQRLTIFTKTAQVIRALALMGHVILVGRGSNFITKEMSNGFHIRIVAPFKWRVQEIATRFNISREESAFQVDKITNERDGFIKDFFLTDVSNPHYYDLIINSASFKLDEAIDLVIYSMERKGLI